MKSDTLILPPSSIFKIALAILVPLSFHINFRKILSICTEYLSGILVEIALNLFFRTDILQCCLAIYEHSESLHLFILSLIPFINNYGSFQNLSPIHAWLDVCLSILMIFGNLKWYYIFNFSAYEFFAYIERVSCIFILYIATSSNFILGVWGFGVEPSRFST